MFSDVVQSWSLTGEYLVTPRIKTIKDYGIYTIKEFSNFTKMNLERAFMARKRYSSLGFELKNCRRAIANSTATSSNTYMLEKQTENEL